MIDFKIPGKAVAKQRPRIARRGKYATTYTPKETVSYENLVKMCASETGEFYEDAPLKVRIFVYFEIPKSVSKKKKQEMIDGLIYPTKKPDLDNIAKSICDAMNGVVYKDDSQIVSLEVVKMYGEIPYAHVYIRGMDE